MNENISYSEIVYLFADKFLPEAGFISSKVEVPTRTDYKVNTVGLSHLLVLSAFLQMRDQELIDLEIQDVKKLFIFSSKAPFVIKKQNPIGIRGLEERLFKNIYTDQSKVFTVVLHLMNDCFDPWVEVVNFVREGLVAKGVMTKTEIKKFIFKNYKYDLVADKAAPYEQHIEKVKERLSENNQLNQIIIKEASKAIALRKEQNDSDD